MKPSYLLPFILSGSLASSQTTSTDTRVCQDYFIPLNVTSQVLVSSYVPFTSNYDVVEFVNNITRRDSATAFAPFSGIRNVTASYTIGATLCIPKENSKNDTTLIVASHGLGFDRRYWDSEIQPANYSFVDFAISRGYSVFFYDRLGTGSSSKVSGYDEAQAETQLLVLQQLTLLLSSGSYTSTIGIPSSIIHIGHSFGSFLTNALLSAYPELSSGGILTGIGYPTPGLFNPGSFISSWALRIASSLAPGEWAGRDTEYLTWDSIYGNVAVFFAAPDTYDEEVAWYTEDVKQPLAAVELLTLSAVPRNSSNFVGPVMVISGEFDNAICGGDCKGILETGQALFPNATDFEAVVLPDVGHAINFSYNATGAYGVMLDYLKKHGF